MTTPSPADFGAVLQGIGSLASALAVAYAAWKASNTFDGWRKQKLSEGRIEQAERILTATYKARRALEYVRSPLVSAYEMSEAENQLERRADWARMSPDLRKKFTTAQAYCNRLDKVLDERREIDECLPMARALFGSGVEEALDNLNRQFQKVGVAAQAITWGTNDRDFERSNRAVLSNVRGPDMPNEMTELVAEKVKIIEDACLPVLKVETED